MTMRCSICSVELDDTAVTFTAGNVVVFRPCADCAKQAKQFAKAGALLGAKRLKATLEERIPDFGRVMDAARKAVRVARVIAEED